MAPTPGALDRLGYAVEWLEWGLLDDGLVQSQLATLERDGEHGTEHFRYAAFSALLRRKAIEDLLVDRYLRLAELDPDPGMARSAVFDLMEHAGLTDDQLARVAKSPLCNPRVLERTRLLRALRAGPIGSELLQACVDSREQRVHEALLVLPHLERDWLEKLAAHGATRAVRNKAAARLRRK